MKRNSVQKSFPSPKSLFLEMLESRSLPYLTTWYCQIYKYCHIITSPSAAEIPALHVFLRSKSLRFHQITTSLCNTATLLPCPAYGLPMWFLQIKLSNACTLLLVHKQFITYLVWHFRRRKLIRAVYIWSGCWVLYIVQKLAKQPLLHSSLVVDVLYAVTFNT